MRPWASRVTSARGSGSSDRIDVLTGYPGRPGGHPERFDAGDMRIAEHDPRNRAVVVAYAVAVEGIQGGDLRVRSEEHTSELQSLMRSSYAVFCLKKKTKQYRRIRMTHN